MGDTSGEAIAPAAAKDAMGRTSFRRPQKNHQGRRADPTAFEALKRAAAGTSGASPTALEMEILFKENPSTVRALRAGGLSDQAIFAFLNRS